ncbi:hypothetical protein [Mucilaginibacter terrae]|uniref:Uncharacterized protein n=1 Tax=Mucilaginibacter terrae TaxID=1955052 RepID=A0ABU3GS89_9SPHI|nr:hypothetical protein [Mucilaginibacter terrae]MDT3402631.1 hypothetical protein [Mucilaginibacter terrae]
MADNNPILIDEIVKLLNGGTAHATLDDALKGLPANQRGEKPHGFYLIVYGNW